MANTALDRRFVLRDLPLPSRLVLTCFLAAIGLGYLSALVQLHFNGGARAGQYIPGPEEAVTTYYGHTGAKPMNRFERLVVTPETEPFTGQGSMRRAFKDKSSGWNKEIRKIENIEEPKAREAALKKLHDEREGEIDAVLAWLRAGADEKAYDKDDFALPERAGGWKLTKDFFVEEEGQPHVKIKLLINERCACCHSQDGGRDRNAAKFELDSYPKMSKYLEVKTASAMELSKLAQTTHVHMFGFAMMYCLTGLIFSFTNCWPWVKTIVAPAAIVTSITEIGVGWWAGRLDPCPAGATAAFGAITAGVLVVQILYSLFDMYDKKGKIVLLVLVLGAFIGGGALERTVIKDFLQEEVNKAKSSAAQPAEKP
ncbi:MAG: hypothetical protein K2R98_05155 [Gemmataceae bacterium]|nr:hypothetical protein [Gemmataceae bacterium]